MTPLPRQKQQHKSTTTTAELPPTRPVDPAARAFARRHGDPATWTDETYRTYAELGGIR